MAVITVALSKGRLADKAIEILSKCGIDCSPLKVDTRELVLMDSEKRFKFIFVKPADVPTYIERGVADLGIVGKDTLLEEGKDIYEMLDLRLGKCKICVAGKPNLSQNVTSSHLRVATKYPNIASRYFASRGQDVEIIKLNGSMELAPIVELSDVIVDIVESGMTLKANGLVVYEDICEISARLVANKVSLKLKSEIILPLIERISKVLED